MKDGFSLGDRGGKQKLEEVALAVTKKMLKPGRAGNAAEVIEEASCPVLKRSLADSAGHLGSALLAQIAD